MKLSKVFSALFGVLGTFLLIASLGVCLLCRNMKPQNQGVPQGASDAAEQFAQALSAGDFESLEGFLYGQPELGAGEDFHSDAATRIWEAFRDSLACENEGLCYLEGTDIYRDVAVTYLDVSGVVKEAASLAKTLEAGEEETAQPDRQLLEVVAGALEKGKTTTVQGRLRLIEDEGRWYVIPDKTVLAAISGGLA